MYPVTEILQTAAATLGCMLALFGLRESHRDLVARRASQRNGLLELVAILHRREEATIAIAQLALIVMGATTISMGPYPQDRASGIAVVRWTFLVFTLLLFAVSAGKADARIRIRRYDRASSERRRRATDA